MGCSQQMIEELFETHYQALYNFCLIYIHRDPRYLPYIEDCIQDAFLYVIRTRRRYENEKHALNTMMKYCRTYFKDMNRKERRRAAITGKPVPLEETLDLCDPVDAIARWCDLEEDRALLQELVQEMTDKEQAVYQHYFEQNMNKEETAEQLNTTENAVKGTVQRIRKKAALKKDFLILHMLAFFMGMMRP